MLYLYNVLHTLPDNDHFRSVLNCYSLYWHTQCTEEDEHKAQKDPQKDTQKQKMRQFCLVSKARFAPDQ